MNVSWWAAMVSVVTLPLPVPLWARALAAVSVAINVYVYLQDIEDERIVPTVTYIHGSTIEGSEHV